MPRSLSASVLAAIAAKTVQLAIFAEIAFADQTLYIFSGIGSYTPAGPPSNPLSTFPYGQTFTGLAWLAKVSAIPQTTKVQAQNITLTLNGIVQSLVNEVAQQVRQTGTATLWLAFFNTSGSLLLDPVQIFSGALDVPTLTDAGETSTASITCENPLISLNLAPNRTFDDTDQQLIYPGDLGFSFVDKLANVTLFWPAPAVWASPYPVYMTVTPSVVDIGVGGSTSVTVTIHYSDGSTKSMPGTGSFVLNWATTDPKIAIINYVGGTNNLVGVSPGTCSVVARVPFFSSGPAQMLRAACNVIVHS